MMKNIFFAKDFRMHFLNACLIVLLYSLVLCGCILQTIRIVGISLAILFSSSIKSCNHKSPMKKSQETAVERFSVYLDTISKSKETTAQIRITKCNRNYKVKSAKNWRNTKKLTPLYFALTHPFCTHNGFMANNNYQATNYYQAQI